MEKLFPYNNYYYKIGEWQRNCKFNEYFAMHYTNVTFHSHFSYPTNIHITQRLIKINSKSNESFDMNFRCHTVLAYKLNDMNNKSFSPNAKILVILFYHMLAYFVFFFLYFFGFVISSVERSIFCYYVVGSLKMILRIQNQD